MEVTQIILCSEQGYFFKIEFGLKHARVCEINILAQNLDFINILTLNSL